MTGVRRMFAALMLGEPAGAELEAAAARALREVPAGDLRRVAPQDLHATLFFLGSVGVEVEERLSGVLKRACAGLRAPDLRIDHTGAFPARGRERILWAGARELPPLALAPLESAVREVCQGAGFAADERPWSLHATLARWRGKGRPRIPPAFYELGFEIPWQPREVALVETLPGGFTAADRSSYRVVRCFPLTS